MNGWMDERAGVIAQSRIVLAEQVKVPEFDPPVPRSCIAHMLTSPALERQGVMLIFVVSLIRFKNDQSTSL